MQNMVQGYSVNWGKVEYGFHAVDGSGFSIHT